MVIFPRSIGYVDRGKPIGIGDIYRKFKIYSCTGSEFLWFIQKIKSRTWYFLLIERDVNLVGTILARSERNIEEIIAFRFNFSEGCSLLSSNINSQGSFTSITAVNYKSKKII